ncbi:energy transducer TonB [candidate division KSB1 bacterium]|nr:energy transducer TonB [candidate division KSB1 bacterium]
MNTRENKRQKIFEISLIVTLAFLIFVFQGWKSISRSVQPQERVTYVMEMVPQPPTEQVRKVTRPQRPAVPLESENPDIPEDATIDPTQISLYDIPPLSAVVEVEELPEYGTFIAFDSPPQPVGGYTAIMKNVVYPELARLAGIDGKVIVYALIDKNGCVADTKIYKSLGNNGCDEAAVDAVRSVKWFPAKQRDKAVSVWIAITIVFKLK